VNHNVVLLLDILHRHTFCSYGRRCNSYFSRHRFDRKRFAGQCMCNKGYKWPFDIVSAFIHWSMPVLCFQLLSYGF